MNIYVLVGTNPLPCYLSALYLLDHYKDQASAINLVCSRENDMKGQGGTEKIAERIKVELEKVGKGVKVEIWPIPDISSDDEIFKFVKKQNLEGNTHLNYTGGTKTMATLIYFNMKTKLGKHFSSSYLDSRRHEMVMDVSEKKVDSWFNVGAELETCDDLRLRYSMSIPDLATLHGIAGIRVKQDSGFNDAAIVMNKLFDKHLDGSRHPFFELFISCGGCYSGAGKKKSSDEDDFRKTAFGEYLDPDSDIEVSYQDAVQSARDLALEDAIKAMPDQNILEKEVGKDKRKKIFEFLDGKWFEYYVVENLRAACSVEDEIAIYFDVGWGDDSRFQLDIVITYGYQLSVISVTTADKKGYVKQKAFEAIHRARQLGGDETKMVVMSFLDEQKTNDLTKELRLDTGSTFPKYRIFGAKDLMDLNQKEKKNMFRETIDFIKE